MFGGSKQEQLEHRLDHKLNASSDGIDMDVPAKVISSETVYTGRIFHVDDMRIALTDKQGKEHEIGRQVLRHAPCVVMLVHDMSTDRYLIEREYRAGSDMFAYGLPAGLMDEGEDIMDAALRELAEETGVVPDRDTMGVDFVGDFYSSEGMTDELAHIMVAFGPVQAGAAPFRCGRACGIRVDSVERPCRHAHHLIQFDDRHPA
jgi:ADP-ribose pyrophosphatase